MADKYFLGTATAVAQIATGSIDSLDTTPGDNTFTVTIGGVAISQDGDTDVATTAAALLAKLQASVHPYFERVEWTNPSAGNITGTAKVAGVPFEAALTETGVGSGAVTDFADDTPSSGPTHWDTAANWSDGVVPANSDNVTLPRGCPDILYGLAQSSVTLASLRRVKGSGKLGLLEASFAVTADGTTPNESYPEYRETYLYIGADIVNSGVDSGIASSADTTRVKIRNAKSGASTCNVQSTSGSTDTGGLPPFRYKAAHASADLVVRSGLVGVAVDTSDETSTLGDILVSASNASTKVQVGPGVTLTNFIQDNGTNFLEAAATITKVEVNGGQLTSEGDYTITTFESNGGQSYLNHIKTGGNCITTANVLGGTADFTRSAQPRTVAALNQDGGTVKLDDAVVTVTAWDQPAGKVQSAVTRL